LKRTAQLGLGTATFIPGYSLGKDRIESQVDLLKSAIAGGIRYVDTAPAYGDSEAALGNCAEEFAQSKVRVCTKLSVQAATDAASAVESVVASRDRVRVTRFDTVLLHSATAGQLEDVAVSAGMQVLKNAGLTQRTGASTYGFDGANSARRQPWCDTIQVEYSIINQSALAAVASSDCEVVVRSVLCKGLLGPRRRQAEHLTEGIEADLDQLDAFAGAWGFDLPELAIRFALDSRGVDIVLVGVSNQAELDTALRAWRRSPLSEEQLGILRSFDRSDLDSVHPEKWVQT
jgi:aryl-alcohol dehydrogenase-like predicted oxidoreductase